MSQSIGMLSIPIASRHRPNDLYLLCAHFYHRRAQVCIVSVKNAQDKSLNSDKPYVLTVSVSTKRNAKSVEIKVADNGRGMSRLVIEKFFQPFFTTKPAGSGAGFSMSDGIINRSHGGELKVQRTEGEGSVFVWHLNCHERTTLSIFLSAVGN